MKTCTACFVEQEDKEFCFRLHGEEVRRNQCRGCRNARTKISNRRRYHEDAEVRRKSLAASRRSALRRRYGMTPAEADALLADQDGACAICGEPIVRFHIDHDHETGKVRGALCARCNLGLGYFRDSRQILANAIAYLSDFQSHGGDPVVEVSVEV